MSLKFSICYYLFFILNILILSDGATAPDNREPLLQEAGIYIGHDSQIKAQDTLDPSELLTQITSSGLLSCRYETSYFMENIIKFLVRYLSLIVNFSAVFGDKNYKPIRKKISNVVSYLESRSSYSNRNKILFLNKASELFEYVNFAVNIKLYSLLFTHSSNISKEVIFIIERNSNNLMHTVSKIVILLDKLSSLEVDSNLRYTSKFLSEVSNDCLRMFNNCIRKYSKMSKSQFNSLFESKIEKLSKSTLSVELKDDFGYLLDMESNFGKIVKSIEAYNQFLETGDPSLSNGEIENAKSIITNYFENGDLDETSIFKQEEIVLISYELLGLAAMNLSLFDESKFLQFKNEVEEACTSARSMINYRGTEIRLSQTIVVTIREEIRTLMRYQEFLRLDFTVMNLDNSLLKSEILHFTGCFYESLLRAFEFVRKEQSRENGGKYINTIYSQLNPLFEKALDYYKSTILNLEQLHGKSKKISLNTISISGKNSMKKVLSKKSARLNRHFPKIKTDSNKKTRKIRTSKKKSLNKFKRIVNRLGNEGVHKSQIKKKSDRQLRAQILSETSQLLRVSKMMKAQLFYLNKINQIETAAIIESVLEISNEILISDGLISQEERETIPGGVDFSNIISSLRTIGDQTNTEFSLFTDNSNEAIDPYNTIFGKKTKILEQYSDQTSLIIPEERRPKLEDVVSLKSSKSVKSGKIKRRADERVRKLSEIGPTVELFDENSVFATNRDSKCPDKLDGSSKMSHKSKSISKTPQKHTRAKIYSSSGSLKNNFSSVDSKKLTKVASNKTSNKSHRNISRRPMMRIMSKKQGCFIINKKLIEERTLFMVPPTLFGQEMVQNMISRYNIKILNFSHVSVNSSYEYITQAIKFCCDEIGYLFFEIFPFLSGIENMILKQIIIQMIVLFKNLVSILIAKDRKKSKSFRRDIR